MSLENKHPSLVVSAERSPQTEILRDVSVRRLTPELMQNPAIQERLRRLHQQEWQRLGLCTDPTALESDPTQFDLAETFVLMTPNQEILAQISTLPVTAASIDEIAQRFSTYHDVLIASQQEATGAQPKASQPNYRICFTITAERNRRIKIQLPDMSEAKSLSTVLLTEVAKQTKETTLAYSRLAGMDSVRSVDELYDHYVQNIAETTNPNKVAATAAENHLGGVGMHERLDGLAVVFFAGSRSADIDGGGGNVIAVYPATPEQTQQFKKIRQTRITHSESIATHRVGTSLVLDDVTL